jgi:CheY-like chemotaxis protein
VTRKRILLVEDDALGREVLRRSLVLLGYGAEVAASGEEAVAAAARRRYDLVLLDCRMTGIDGFEALRRIRAAEGEGARTRVVAMTADASPGFAERIRAAGFDGFLAKPFRVEELKALIERWLA